MSLIAFRAKFELKWSAIPSPPPPYDARCCTPQSGGDPLLVLTGVRFWKDLAPPAFPSPDRSTCLVIGRRRGLTGGAPLGVRMVMDSSRRRWHVVERSTRSEMRDDHLMEGPDPSGFKPTSSLQEIIFNYLKMRVSINPSRSSFPFFPF